MGTDRPAPEAPERIPTASIRIVAGDGAELLAASPVSTLVGAYLERQPATELRAAIADALCSVPKEVPQ